MYQYFFSRDLGIPEMYLERVIGKLTKQLSTHELEIKKDCFRTLKAIGGNRQDVIAAMLPKLIYSQVRTNKHLGVTKDQICILDSLKIMTAKTCKENLKKKKKRSNNRKRKQELQINKQKRKKE